MPRMYAPVALLLLSGGLHALGSVPALAQASWEDVLPQVKQRCINEWPNDYSMQAFCIKRQRKGWEEVNTNDIPSPRSSASSNTPPPVLPFPSGAISEVDLVKIVRNYVNLYNLAPNDMIKGGLRPDRGREICRLLRTPNVKNWHGTVYSLSSNNNGNGVLEIDLGGDVFVKTMNNELSDMQYHTLIPHGTSLFADAAMLRKGQTIEFSGSLFHDDIDCFKETSLTVDGAMRSPEFLIRLSSVKHQDDGVSTLPSTVATHTPWTGDSLAAALGSPHIPAAQTAPASSSGSPIVAAPTDASNTASVSLQSAAFVDGRNARIAYENWFAAITIEDRRAGATFWASNRSTKSPPATCHYASPEFETGCLEAKRLLAPSDTRRKTERDFKLGWNSL